MICDVLSQRDIDMMTSGLLVKENSEPKKIKTFAQAIQAIKKCSCGYMFKDMLKEVPEKFKTKKFWLEAVKAVEKGHDHALEKVLKEVPKKFKTKELWFEVVKKSAFFLIDVPEKFITVDMCIEAVKQENWVFMLVPESLKEQVTEATGIPGGAARKHYKYESALEKGIKEIFGKEAERICFRVFELCKLARREGIIAIENYIDKEKLSAGDILETGIQMVVDAVKKEKIEKHINSLIKANSNNSVAYYEKILASIIKTGIFCLWAGENPKVAECKLKVLIPRELVPESLLSNPFGGEK